MKLFLKTSIALFTMAFFISSCKNKKIVPPPTNEPDPIIKIINCDGDSLVLSDGGKTTTTRSNVVFWKIDNACIKEIKKISMKDNITPNVNVFDDGDPRKMNPNNQASDWRGRVKPHLPLPGGASVFYKYKIVWIDNLGNEHTFDPEIEIDQ